MKKITQSVFMSRCYESWGSMYDLSSVLYTGFRNHINVTCRIHGEFSVRAGNFLHNKSGCPTCGGQKAKKTPIFIAEAKNVHGDRYDYSCSDYTNARTPLTIICKVHGEFHQLPTTHIKGSGCPSCAKIKKLSTDEFIRRSKLIFNDIYDYTKVEYRRSTDKVIIICKIHGEFYQLPHNHLAGGGCKLCANDALSDARQSTLKYVTSQCTAKGVTIVSYAGNSTGKSTLKCKNGHTWEASISKIQQGSGCPTCATPGYDPSRYGYVYFLTSKDGKYMKVGLSNAPKKRIRSLQNTTPFPFDIIGWNKMKGVLAPKREHEIHKQCKPANLSGFDGCTEWFVRDDAILSRYFDML